MTGSFFFFFLISDPISLLLEVNMSGHTSPADPPQLITHLPLLLLSITFRYSDFSSTLGVYPARDQEAQVSVHGVLGEQEGGTVPLP